MSTTPKGADFLPEWKRGEEIGIIFDDITKQDRTAFNINEMFTQLQEVAKTYGFDLKMWGLKPNFEQSINKNLAKDKESLIELLTNIHFSAHDYKQNSIKKYPMDTIIGQIQRHLISHNILKENPSSGELTLNNKSV